MTFVSPAPRVLADFASKAAIAQVALVIGGAAFVGIAAQIAIPLPFTPVAPDPSNIRRALNRRRPWLAPGRSRYDRLCTCRRSRSSLVL